MLTGGVLTGNGFNLVEGGEPGSNFSTRTSICKRGREGLEFLRTCRLGTGVVSTLGGRNASQTAGSSPNTLVIPARGHAIMLLGLGGDLYCATNCWLCDLFH